MNKGALALTIVGGIFVAMSLIVIVVTIILTAVLFVVINLLTDLLYAVIDPRIRRGAR